jgi:hypothetical protein
MGNVSGAGASGNSPLAQIGQALQNGNLTGAQQALQTMQAGRSHGHHHHGSHQGGSADSTATSSTTATPTASIATSTGPGSLLNTTA